MFAHAAFGLLIRHARSDPFTYFKVGGTNYFVGMVLALVGAIAAGGLRFEWPASLLAVYQGVQYQLAYIVLFALIAVGGLAVTLTMLRLSVVVPVLGSILIWGESPSMLRIIGILLALSALPLVGSDARRTAHQIGLRRPMLLMFLAIAMSGSGALAAKAFVEIQSASTSIDYSLFVFIGATGSTILTWPLARHLAGRRDLTWFAGSDGGARSWRRWAGLGAALGAANVAQNTALVQALAELPGSFVFPVISSGYLLLITLADYVIWKRRFGRITLIGIVLAVAGLALVNQ